MDNEIKTPEPSNQTVLVVAQPSVKDQLVQTAVGLGVTIALGAAVIGLGAGIDAIGRARANRKAKKAAKNVTVLQPVETDAE